MPDPSPPPAERLGGRRGRLTREKILRAALELADEGGLEALTMQRVGARLGVEAMSLYRHVRNKDDLLDGLVDLVFAEIELPDADDDWRRGMRVNAISTRDALTRHPWAISVLESRLQPGPASLRHHDEVVGVLLRAGFSSAMATRIFNVADSYVFGFVLQERSLPFEGAEGLAEVGGAMVDEFPSEQFPNLYAVAKELIASGFDYSAEFEPGLDVVLEGLARVPLEG